MGRVRALTARPRARTPRLDLDRARLDHFHGVRLKLVVVDHADEPPQVDAFRDLVLPPRAAPVPRACALRVRTRGRARGLRKRRDDGPRTFWLWSSKHQLLCANEASVLGSGASS